jgi:hypothetical protein
MRLPSSFARCRHARGVGEREVALVEHLFNRRDADLARPGKLVILERRYAQLLTQLFFIR